MDDQDINPTAEDINVFFATNPSLLPALQLVTLKRMYRELQEQQAETASSLNGKAKTQIPEAEPVGN